MPRDNRRGRKGPKQSNHSDDECDTPDNFSVASSLSETHSAPAEDEEVEDTSQQEVLEDQLRDLIEGLTQKSAKGRAECLQGIQTALSKKYMYDFLIDRKLTLCDGLERCVKRGGGQERASGAYCIALLLTQLGTGDDSTELYHQVAPLFSTTVADASAPMRARTACAEVLGLSTFIAGGDLQGALSTMQMMETIFKASYLKGDGTLPAHQPDVSALHTGALSSWALLLSILPSHAIGALVQSHLGRLPDLLRSTDVELRIAAGETIALLYELARERDEDFEDERTDELCEQLRQLSTDGHKSKSKKDRRQQRGSFRAILRAVADADEPDECIKFGGSESMVLDSWGRKFQYEAFCGVLASGMNAHLRENSLLRDIFDLGDPIPSNAVPSRKVSKYERNMINAAASKKRTKARLKFRDKRVAVHGES